MNTSMTAVINSDNEKMHSNNIWFPAVAPELQRRFSGAHQQGIYIEANDGLLPKRCINFASNDYLGLRNHPKVMQAAINAIQEHGLGSGASRMVSGDNPMMHQLEQELAAWKGYEACLLVGSGMLANIGLIQAIADRHTSIFADKLNHASLLDGARLSNAKLQRFIHLDMQALEQQLASCTTKKRLIVSDGVFSMDGDCANVHGLLALAEQYDALLLLDDAHGSGIIGTDGRGLSADIAGHPRLIEVGTFGKAFGGYGAFILASSDIVAALQQRLRTMIYSTALPLSMIYAMQQALHLIQCPSLRQQLITNIRLFKELSEHLNLLPSSTPIQALLIGENEVTMQAAQHLRQIGFFVPAIRPPTVPKGTARLRITLSAVHSPAQISALVTALKKITT